MSRIQIDRITNKRDWQPEGKKYKIHEFICDGYIDGEPASGFKVKAIGKEKGEAIRPGIEIELEKDTYGGETKYVVPKDFKSSDVRSSTPPPSPSAGRQTQGRPQTQASAMSRDEFDALFRHAMDVVAGKLQELNCMVGGAEDRSVESEALAKLTSTYIIATLDNGIREHKPEPEKPQEEQVTVDMAVILEVLEKKNLVDRVEKAGITEEELTNAWIGSQASPLKFGIIINELLKKRESEPSEEMPF